VTLTALDPEYPIEVQVDDSPLFNGLLTHWEGQAETVVNLESHYYEEVISLTVTQRHVVTLKQSMLAPTLLAAPVATFSVHETGPMPAISGFGENDIDDTVTFIEKAWIDEAKKRHRFHRTRLFFRLVWCSYKEARAA